MKRTQLHRRTGLLRRSRLNPISRRRRAEADERAAVWSTVLRRDCDCLLERLGRARAKVWIDHDRAVGVDRCVGRLTPHHLRKASQGGDYSTSNLVVLCEGHNGWVERWPRAAHLLGLVVRQGENPVEAYRRRQLYRLGTR